MYSIFQKVLIAAFVFTVSNCSFAGSWDFLTPFKGPKKDINTLVITANYKHPLIIAQLIQEETKQPYLLLPAANSKGIFFNPPRARSEDALEIREDNLARFIRFLSPKQVVILGDKRYVSEKYQKMIFKEIPVIRVSGNNWQKIADRLAILLEAYNIGSDYKKLSSEIDSGLYQPTAPEKESEKPVAFPVLEDKKEEIILDNPAPKADIPVETTVKEPEVIMPKSTPQLIKDK
jgi:hypothetical protein